MFEDLSCNNCELKDSFLDLIFFVFHNGNIISKPAITDNSCTSESEDFKKKPYGSDMILYSQKEVVDPLDTQK